MSDIIADNEIKGPNGTLLFLSFFLTNIKKIANKEPITDDIKSVIITSLKPIKEPIIASNLTSPIPSPSRFVISL
jgi:hypothetical protein